MITLDCPCGHSVPFPEESGNYKCTRCGRSHPIRWFEGPRAYADWHAWMLARALPPGFTGGSRKNFVTSQHDGKETSTK